MARQEGGRLKGIVPLLARHRMAERACAWVP